MNPDTLKNQGFTRIRRAPIDIDGKQAFRILYFKGSRQKGQARTQAVRFPKDKWSADQASKWCREKEGSFEKAKPKELEIKQIKELVSDPLKIQESFQWVPAMDKVRALSRQGKGKFLKIVALHPIVTDRKEEGHGPRKFSSEELKRSARTLAKEDINLLHKVKLVHGNNKVIDAEEEEDKLECLAYVEDHEILAGIRAGTIDKVSIQGNARQSQEHCHQGTCAQEPVGIMYSGLAMVNSKQPFRYNGTVYQPAPPGDIRTTIEIVETITSQSQQNYSYNQINPQTKQMDFTEWNEEQAKVYLAGLDSIAENLEAMITAINKVDAPPEFKEKLIALAKQLYAEKPLPPGGNGNGAEEIKKLNDKVATIETKLAKLDDIERKLTEITTNSDKKLEELFNKVATEKFEAFKKDIKEMIPRGTKDVQDKLKSLEQLTKTQTSAILAEKIRNTPLSELMTRYDNPQVAI